MDGAVVKQAMQELRAAERDLRAQLGQNSAGQLAIQGLCPHSWEDRGYDPRGGGTQHDVCRYCGLERRT